jgi:hypothetical protein
MRRKLIAKRIPLWYSGVSRTEFPSASSSRFADCSAWLAKQYPDTNGGREVRVVDMVDDLAAGSKQFLGVLMVRRCLCCCFAALMLQTCNWRVHLPGKEKSLYARRLAQGGGESDASS